MNPEQMQLRHDDPDAFGRKFVEHTLKGDREWKVEMTVNGPDDLPNRVIYLPADKEKLIIIVPMSIGMDNALPSEEIGICCRIARQQEGGPFMITFCAEVYMQTEFEEKDVPAERGVITQRYKNGNPNVTEALTIMGIHPRLSGELRIVAVQMPFRYEDGSVTFGEEIWVDSINDGMPTGAIPQALVAAFGSEQN